jgi:hypothetical protein
VARHLEFYPDATTRPYRRISQGSKWLHELDGKYLTPMVRDRDGNAGDIYVDEVCLLDEGRPFVPRRFFKRDDTMWAKGYRLSFRIESRVFTKTTVEPEEIRVQSIQRNWIGLAPIMGMQPTEALIGNCLHPILRPEY